MNNLIIFGDSFSTHYSTDDSVLLEESWPILLSKELKFNLINNSLVGASNGEILNSFFNKYESINDGDIVILEIGFFNRLLDSFKNTTFTLGFGGGRFSELETKFYESKIFELDEYIMQDFVKFKFICEYLQQKNIQFYIWCVTDYKYDTARPKSIYFFENELYDKFKDNFILFNDKLSLMDEVIEKNPKFWVNNSDKHFNKLGHEYFFLYLYDIIKGIQRKKLI